LEVFADALKHLVLPASVLGLVGVASISRITRSSMLEVLSQEYVKTARIKGCPNSRHRPPRPAECPGAHGHGGRAHLWPAFGGSVLTETIFSWPGLGRYMANAFLTLDLNTIVGGTMFVALTFCLVNLLVDLAYAFLNPKITYTES